MLTPEYHTLKAAYGLIEEVLFVLGVPSWWPWIVVVTFTTAFLYSALFRTMIMLFFGFMVGAFYGGDLVAGVEVWYERIGRAVGG